LIPIVARADQVETFDIDPLSGKTLTFNLSDGQKVTGSVSITGGSGNDVDIWVTNPTGNTILNLGRVSQGIDFEFTADKDGAYTLHFDNSFSILSSKNIYLTYDASLPTIAGIDPILLIALVSVIIIILLVAIVVLRRSRKQKNIQNEKL
jgi:hypothetical protein